MKEARYHLAQFNLARAKAALDDPRMRGFVEKLQSINQLADKDPAHIWRLQTESGDATAIRAYPEDPSLLLTLSVWTSVKALTNFTYRGPHADVMRSRAEWFEHIDEHYIVLWYVRAGTLPSLDEAKDRLTCLRTHGPTPYAFTFKVAFSPEEAESYDFINEGVQA
jgi:hypothetical protein